MNRVGNIYPSILPYFNKKEKKIKYKSRPVLIIAEPIGLDTEYTVLPVSTISNQAFYNSLFDTELLPDEYPELMISRKSYIRSHKQTTVYKSIIDFDQCIGEMKRFYPETYYQVIEKLEKFNQSISENCYT